MKNITIRKLPDEIHKRLKQRAKASHRSLNNEIIACLEEVVLPNKTEINKLLESSEKIRNNLNFSIEVDDITKAKQK